MTDNVAGPGREYRFGAFVLQPAARRLLRDGETVVCPRLVFDLLHYLVEHRERAIGRDELAAAVWRRPDVADVQIGQVVLRARRAVGDDGSMQHSIATVPGFGYHWVAATQAVPDATPMPARATVPESATRHEPAMPDEPVRDAVGEAPPPNVDAAAPRGDTPRTEPAGARTRGRLLFAAAVVVAVCLAAALLVARQGRDAATRDAPPPTVAATPAAASGVLLLPLRVQGRSEDAWLRLGGMDLVADRLRAAGVSVPASESVLAALRTVEGTPDAARGALRAAFGDLPVVEGEAARAADGTWTVALSARSADGLPRSGTAREDDAVAATIAAADALAAALGGTPSGDPASALDADADWRRARAALLANEVDVARTILTTSRSLAARPLDRAVHLAQVDVRAGRLAEAETALGATLAQLPADAATLRAQAHIVRGSARARLGRFDAAWQDFDAALASLPANAPPLERARALSGRGSSAVPSGRFDDAFADMGQARSLFAALGDPFGTARVDANLGMLELYRARPAAALTHLDAAAAGLHAFGAEHEWQVVLTAQVESHLALLQHDAAGAAAERGWSRRAHARDPEQRSDIALNRAEVLLAGGRHREAAALLADPQLDAAQGTVLRARVGSLRARLALRQRRWKDAATLAHAALAAWPAQGAERERERLALVELRAWIALGEVAAARTLAQRPPSPFLLADDLAWRELAQAAWRQAQDNRRGELDTLRAAIAAAGESGVPATLAAVAETAVPALLELGRPDEARALAGRVASFAANDFDCALVQVRVLHADGAVDAWRAALETAQALAGEREVPAALRTPPSAR
ncbi:winged helix-turn-helix domain-containing protein [Chiayiivirga flava]|uniref:DNA-binding winged helix-turn-helix (WHTH) protein/tetratricopeptide (TPR) repeat protein n=1 Tax=Chiayiivirga flava TaxID=659595 RepID=A0A7W8D5P4_9GAMM|nr:winged helix-turn-helix domain-containing protein [Chiayiivirga flava]MBB5208393.1 DNA-binding winged helix-turn-helix (wHTH) protein/tetratricopeptide (TPR) repeat protein [Chiayiivirga flava]